MNISPVESSHYDKKRDMENKEVMTLVIEGEKYCIKLQGTTEKPYFCGKDVCEVLGYKNIRNALFDHVGKQDKCALSEVNSRITSDSQTPLVRLGVDVTNLSHNDKLATYITKTGFEHLLMRSRIVKNPNIIRAIVDQCGLNLNHIIESKEQDTIGKIIEVFNDENYETQFRIGSYRIDLYFPDQKIAVECDEFGHIGRDQSREKARQMYIENRLGCEFVRYNPDAKDFSIFKVIKKLMRRMTAFKVNEKLAELTTFLAEKDKE